MGKSKVITKCVANNYAGPHGRIVEFSFPSGNGGLISFFTNESGKEIVEVYRTDAEIEVRCPKDRQRGVVLETLAAWLVAPDLSQETISEMRDLVASVHRS